MALTTDGDLGNRLTTNVVLSQSELVEVVALDEVPQLRHLDRRRRVILKIDAEGYDLQVLRGAEKTIQHHQPVIVVETWGDGSVYSWLRERDYRAFSCDRVTGTLTLLRV